MTIPAGMIKPIHFETLNEPRMYCDRQFMEQNPQTSLTINASESSVSTCHHQQHTTKLN